MEENAEYIRQFNQHEWSSTHVVPQSASEHQPSGITSKGIHELIRWSS